MKSKFMLHGGSCYVGSGRNFEYFRGLADIEKETLNVYVIPFAMFPPKERIGKANPEDLVRTARRCIYDTIGDLKFVNPHKKFVPIDPSTSIQKALRKADIIFAHGGNGDNLQSYFEGIDMSVVTEDKIIGGNSAGCNMWVDHYYSNDNQKVCKGLGVIPVKTMCHFNIQKIHKFMELVKFGDIDMDAYPLGNFDFIEVHA